ncbi:MAG: ABC transporter ATP-binding protein [Desulfobulbaceae bacterium]|nr:ABC transporter ATP-binding protein [Desulfobulbaceae bacterium]
MESSAYIRTEEVKKVYNPGRPDEMTALHDVSLEIDKGKVTVLQGPSGSGKTSLLSALGCMSRPTAGRVIVDGKDVVKLPERFLTDMRRKKFGFIFQHFYLIRNVTVLENILLPLYPLNLMPAAMKERAMALMHRFGIAGKKNLKVKNLSGGEQQRVAIARALINNPEVIIADEPTAHLDMQLAGEFMDILAGQAGTGKTIVIATHDPFVYEHPLVDRIISMRDGRIEGAR